MRRCKVIVEGELKYELAYFHMFGECYIANIQDTSIIGIIELPDGTVKEVAPEYIVFLDPIKSVSGGHDGTEIK